MEEMILIASGFIGSFAAGLWLMRYKMIHQLRKGAILSQEFGDVLQASANILEGKGNFNKLEKEINDIRRLL